ncbi:hypothetical protein [Aureitalea marina]|uniref:Sugar transporter n=1 Tax=Aureitalea marina TaxID=930804 RepID=A0A2S7KP85_9FLAO|nr:hypothetical protein [Aureitalea marina]PQB04432.1 hypothetical protein BST85_05605 [Aureitalea marina]
MTDSNKPNTAFWIIAVVALIWNIMGVMAYLGSVYMDDATRDLMTPEQIELMEATPAWVTGIFAIATFAGVLGALLMVLKRKLAVPLFAISLIAVLIQNVYAWFATNAAEVYGTVQGYVMPLLVITISIFLFWYSKGATQKGWLK